MSSQLKDHLRAIIGSTNFVVGCDQGGQVAGQVVASEAGFSCAQCRAGVEFLAARPVLTLAMPSVRRIVHAAGHLPVPKLQRYDLSARAATLQPVERGALSQARGPNSRRLHIDLTPLPPSSCLPPTTPQPTNANSRGVVLPCLRHLRTWPEVMTVTVTLMTDTKSACGAARLCLNAAAPT